MIKTGRLRLAVQAQVRHVIMMIGAKVALNGALAREAARERDQSARLSQNSRKRFGRKLTIWESFGHRLHPSKIPQARKTRPIRTA